MLLQTFCIIAAFVTIAATGIEPSPHGRTISDGHELEKKTASLGTLKGDPPYGGTIFVEPEIINSSDPTTYLTSKYTGTGMREMYDRRNGWITVLAYLFEVTYKKGVKVEFQVHREFGNKNKATQQVHKYARHVGKIPMVMLKEISEVWIMKGVNLWGGGLNYDGTGHILIHTGKGDEYVRDGILEETLMHEAAHGSLDRWLYNNAWYAAARKDDNYISDYARDYPDREDIAETIVMYFAVEYTKNRLSNEDLQKTISAIPNRIEYLNSLSLDMYPFKKVTVCDGLGKVPCNRKKKDGSKVCIYNSKKKILGECQPKKDFAYTCLSNIKDSCINESDRCKWRNKTCMHICMDLGTKQCRRRKINGKKVCRLPKLPNPCYGCHLKSECE